MGSGVSDGRYPAWWRLLLWPAWQITLEPVSPEHTARVRRALTEEIARWLGVGSAVEMRAATAEWAHEAYDLAGSGEAFRYLIHRAQRFAGAIEVRPDAVRGHVGYWLRRAERGCGTITYANRLVLPIAYEGLGLRAVDWTADVKNDASIAVMHRLGADLVGVFPVRNLLNRTAEVRYRLPRRKFVAEPTGPKSLRDLLT